MKIPALKLIIFMAAPLCLITTISFSQTNSTQNIETNLITAARDPFWPVGFFPVSESKVKEQEQINQLQSRIKWPKLKLVGITKSSDNNYIAILEKIGIIEEGDIISVQKNDIIYRWKINTINNKGISRTQLSAKEILPPLTKR